jgi:hypothetical protein
MPSLAGLDDRRAKQLQYGEELRQQIAAKDKGRRRGQSTPALDFAPPSAATPPPARGILRDPPPVSPHSPEPAPPSRSGNLNPSRSGSAPDGNQLLLQQLQLQQLQLQQLMAMQQAAMHAPAMPVMPYGMPYGYPPPMPYGAVPFPAGMPPGVAQLYPG